MNLQKIHVFWKFGGCSLTLIRLGFLVNPKTGGGLNQDEGFIEVLRLNLSPKFTINGLKWHFGSSSFYKIFENHPVIHNISKMWCQSNLIWWQKILSFQNKNLWKFENFSLILTLYTSYESWNHFKLIFDVEKYSLIKIFFKNWIFQNFQFNFLQKKIFLTQIFQIFFYTAPKIFIFHYS